MERVPNTIPELLESRVREAPDAPWLFFEDRHWTHADTADEVDRAAAALAARGVVKGDTVVILLGNRPETIFTWFGANRLGAAAMIVNPSFKPAEREALFAVAKPRVVVEEPLAGDVGGPVAAVDVAPDDVTSIVATSGTSGTPKLVPQTHGLYALVAEALPWWLGLDARDRLMTSLPLFHINAQLYSTIGSLGAKASLVLLPKFSASRFWEDAKRYGATELNAVGAMIHILLATEPKPSDRDHSVRLVYSALALPEEKHRAFEERFGVKMIVGYGMSETPFGTIWPLDQPPRYGTMGVLRQHPRLGVVNEARVAEDGELSLKNPATHGAWLATGDIVKRDDDGWFTFVSRKRDILRRRGENVAAAEIEAVLLAHDDVLEAAVVAVPSELGEDDIAAFVVAKEGKVLDVEQLRAFCKDRLADFKVPTEFAVRDALPKNATQRIQKHLLRL